VTAASKLMKFTFRISYLLRRVFSYFHFEFFPCFYTHLLVVIRQSRFALSFIMKTSKVDKVAG